MDIPIEMGSRWSPGLGERLVGSHPGSSTEDVSREQICGALAHRIYARELAFALKAKAQTKGYPGDLQGEHAYSKVF